MKLAAVSEIDIAANFMIDGPGVARGRPGVGAGGGGRGWGRGVR
ncbi:hypothetical protein GA0070611_0588 [Micromonospora auratinigra]|uniref:Uncharacterized protein n=1 Tax=Micromonospora auratinigra TaxID=261654 RepID=A0A1A8Z3Z0_9ACTN|nr:hypothetical protein GA0070611_0588 [Micromonospora auratinigra]